MLTLLSLRLMDSVWKAAGLDYGIIPYRCLSTGPLLGLIQVVVNADTLGRIQATKGFIMGAWREDSLYAWLDEKSDKNDEYVISFISLLLRTFYLVKFQKINWTWLVLVGR